AGATVPVALRQCLRRDGQGTPAHQPVRQHVTHPRPGRPGYTAGIRRYRLDHSRRFRRLTMPPRVVLGIGTRKGLFIAEASRARGRFAIRGPFATGVAVYAIMIDTRGKPAIYASSCNPFFGMKVLRSTDLGKTFKETKASPAFPKDDGRALANTWSLAPGPGPKDLLCGV